VRKKGKGRERGKEKEGVKTKKVTFREGKTREEEIDDITQLLPGLKIHDAAYANAYVRLQVFSLDIARLLQQPGTSSPVAHYGHDTASNAFQRSAPSMNAVRLPLTCYFCQDPTTPHHMCAAGRIYSFRVCRLERQEVSVLGKG
jgi:hypothetical protein